MTREELKSHCEKEIARCEFWSHNDNEKLNNSKIYQEHKLVLELLQQEPCDGSIYDRLLDVASDIKALIKQLEDRGLDEQLIGAIKCLKIITTRLGGRQ